MTRSHLRTGRGIELGYVLATAFVVASAEAIVEITRDNRLTSHVATYAAVVLATGLISHAAIRRFARWADPLMLPCALLLLGLGLVMIHRLDLGLAQQAAENGTKYNGVAAASQVVLCLPRPDRVPGRAGAGPRSPFAGAVRLHPGPGRAVPAVVACCPAGPVQRGERGPDLDPDRRLLHPAR